MLPQAQEAIEKFDGIAARVDAILSQIIALFPMMEENKEQTLADRLIFFHQASEFHDKIDAIRKKLYKAIDGWDKSYLPQQFEASGQDSARVPAIGRSFYPIDKFTASVVAEKKPEAYAWLRANNAGDIITETVNAGTLATFIRSMQQEHNIDPPEALFKTNSYQVIGSSRYTVKEERKSSKKASTPA